MKENVVNKEDVKLQIGKKIQTMKTVIINIEFNIETINGEQATTEIIIKEIQITIEGQTTAKDIIIMDHQVTNNHMDIQVDTHHHLFPRDKVIFNNENQVKMNQQEKVEMKVKDQIKVTPAI